MTRPYAFVNLARRDCNYLICEICGIYKLGIMMNGTTIDSTVVGGPAFNSKQFSHGDVILAVNGVPATNDNVLDLLVGSDIPGTPVEIRVAKGNFQAR